LNHCYTDSEIGQWYQVPSWKVSQKNITLREDDYQATNPTWMAEIDESDVNLFGVNFH
jgi:hypothetical protein